MSHLPAPPPHPRPTIDVQEDFVVYRCKLDSGKVIELPFELPLPMKLTKADVARISLFMETQVDDAEARP